MLAIGHINQAHGQIGIAHGEIVADIPNCQIDNFLQRFCVSRQSCVNSLCVDASVGFALSSRPYNIVQSLQLNLTPFVLFRLLSFKFKGAALGKSLWFHGIQG